MRFISVVALALMATGAQAQSLTVHNPGPARDSAVIDLPAPMDAKVQSARIGDTAYPVQALNAKFRLVAPLKAGDTMVTLSPDAAPEQPRRVLVTLNIQDGGHLEGDANKGGAIKGGTFHLRDRFTSPPDHFIHDGLIAFEGIGWESDKVAYRLYLDERNVTDIFGKYGSGMIFPNVGHGFDDYQYPVAWGGDIFKVGASLGVGGIGLLRDGKATQIGPSTITGRVIANGPVTAIAGVDADAIGGGKGSVHATYAITAGSVITEVTVKADQLAESLVTGLTVHPGDQTLTPQATGDWTYIAAWGAQEHGPDCVGWAVFYRASDVTGAPVNDGQTLFIRFKSPTDANYRFGARWTQEGRDAMPGIRDLAGFRAWLEQTTDELNHPLTIGG
ncbi:DUF4861 family protein [Asticcacaulis taihuensis]|uniref:DUF4861 family protein n=1 Tax=Asticcacaulis taihuensis TaxID=260084 RepID=UPI0026EB34B7|nr:DUF4861 family protein [Asticcacaulis taihuensis]